VGNIVIYGLSGPAVNVSCLHMDLDGLVIGSESGSAYCVLETWVDLPQAAHGMN
jgi:hypothetical protein